MNFWVPYIVVGVGLVYLVYDNTVKSKEIERLKKEIDELKKNVEKESVEIIEGNEEN